MIEFLRGRIVELTPTYLVLDVGGVGYFLNISLNTFEQLQNLHKELITIYVHQIIREDSITLYGFYSKDEREIFRLLLSVSGVGSATARLMLSSLKPDEVREAILRGDVGLLKSIKGIGAKTAQRIIVDLKDKIGAKEEVVLPAVDTVRQDAIDALVTLGFNKKSVEKVVNKLLKSNPKYTVEELIKASFKYLT